LWKTISSGVDPLALVMVADYPARAADPPPIRRRSAAGSAAVQVLRCTIDPATPSNDPASQRPRARRRSCCERGAVMSSRASIPARILLATLATIGGATGLTSCGDDDSTSSTEGATPVVDPGDGGVYAPVIDPASFVERIDNPYLPFLPGARWVFVGESDGETERVEVTVLEERKVVMGISAVVVRDRVEVDGVIAEDTFDWFAQDGDGNVWYLGEAVQDYENGEPSGTGGSWEAGVDGALPGIVMPARPSAGAAFRQEYYEGEAEDMFEILSITGSRTVPAGTFEAVVETEDWNPLEPDTIEHKFYAPGVGLIFEEKVAGGDGFVELVEFTPGA
jgi:hypothetical protein